MPEADRASRLERAWYGGRPHPLLQPLSWLYGAIIGLRRGLYSAGLLRSRHAGVPTVVVGNLTAGGTGKTPLVLWLAAEVRRHGRRPGIVLRGYRGSQRAAHRVMPEDGAGRVGDEAVLLARRAGCPVAVGARRAEAARLLVEQGCDLILSDDGLQHLAMARDFQVLVIDGGRGFGNGALLPAGPLREPAARLQQADVVVMHGPDRHGLLPAGRAAVCMQLVPGALVSLATGQVIPLQQLQGRTVHAVAGIGHPERFFATLRELGALPLEHPLPDHHPLNAADLSFGDGHWIVMTEKDAVKCSTLAAGRDDLYFLQVSAVLPDPDGARLVERVLSIRRT